MIVTAEQIIGTAQRAEVAEQRRKARKVRRGADGHNRSRPQVLNIGGPQSSPFYLLQDFGEPAWSGM